METIKTHEEKQRDAQALIEAAGQGVDVRSADPRDTSIEAVVMANRIRRSQGAAALNMVRSAL